MKRITFDVFFIYYIIAPVHIIIHESEMAVQIKMTVGLM